VVESLSRHSGTLPQTGVRRGAPLCAPRFGADVRELSGRSADLGTFIPHIVGAITVVGMAPSGMFLSFGLFYLFSGAFYGLPIPCSR
jgi:hypothetical protein